MLTNSSRDDGCQDTSHLETQLPIALPEVPTLQHWSSAIGLFIINFGMLDLHLQDFLQSILPPEEFTLLRDGHFQNRVKRLKEHIGTADYPMEKKQAIAQFFVQLEPIRELRNHIAHGLLRSTRAEDQNTWFMTLSVPKSLDGSSPAVARHLTYQELTSAATALKHLIESFQSLFGNWVVDAEIRF